MRMNMTVTMAASVALFLLACDARTTMPSASTAVDLRPQFERVNNGGCPPMFRPVAWGVGVDPDRNEDGVVCLWDGTKREHTPPPIDNNVPVVIDGVGLVSSMVEAPLLSVSSVTVNRCIFTFTTQPITLAPPDHKYAQLNVSDLIPGFSDSCDPSANLARNSRIICIGSDEAEDAPGGDGSSLVDMTINGPTTMALRAERDPRLDGRVYTIAVQVTDGFGNIASTTATVAVPVSKQATAVWGPGPGYSIGAETSSCL